MRGQLPDVHRLHEAPRVGQQPFQSGEVSGGGVKPGWGGGSREGGAAETLGLGVMPGCSMAVVVVLRRARKVVVVVWKEMC